MGRRGFWLWALLAASCDDAGSAAPSDAGAGGRAPPAVGDLGSAGSDGGADLALVDLGRGGDAAGGGPGGDGGPACIPGARRCVEQGGAAYELCDAAGESAIEICPETTVCLGAEARCLPDPATCPAGARVCLDGRTPAECQPGAGWQALPTCPDGGACAGAGECISGPCASALAQRSYQGCEFLATDLPNAAWAPGGGTPESPLGVVVANPDRSAPVHVTARDAAGALAALVAEVTIQPPALFGNLPPASVATELRDGTGAVTTRAFNSADSLEIPPGGLATLLFAHHGTTQTSRLAATAWQVSTDRPVVAYQFGPFCCNFSFSNDASLLLPIGALGTEYVNVGVPSWADRPMEGFEFDGLPATLTVVGTQPGTAVTIDLPAGAGVLPVPGPRVQIQGGQVQVTLDRGEVLDLLSEPARSRGPDEDPEGVDLTGAIIRATAPVAVFSGHECSFYPQTQGACDHLEEQLFPVDTWGDRYLLAPTKLRTRTPELATEATFWKFVAGPSNETRVTLSVPLDALSPSPPGFVGVSDCRERLEDDRSFRLGPGESCEFGSRAGFGATGDQVFSVLGIMSGEASTGLLNGGEAGDPSIFLAAPERQHRFQYVFLTPGTYSSDYVTILAPAGAQVAIDDAPVDLAGGSPVLGEDWVYTHVLIDDGAHFVAGDQRFGVVVYAYDDWVSYAFTGGLDLQKR